MFVFALVYITKKLQRYDHLTIERKMKNHGFEIHVSFVGSIYQNGCAEHTAAITEDGSLYGWGWGRYGNLGLGGRNHCLAPQQVSAVDVCLISGIG